MLSSVLFLCLMSQKCCPTVQADSSDLYRVGAKVLAGRCFGVHGGKTPVKVKVPQVEFMLSVQDRDQLTPLKLAQLGVENHVVLKVTGFVVLHQPFCVFLAG